MAIDTVTLRSPFISEELAKKIEQQSILRQKVDQQTGEVLHSFTTKSLEGSFDARISVKVERSKRGFGGRNIKCEPYVTLECSVHKQLMGHNVYGGPEHFQTTMVWLVEKVGEWLGVPLPSALLWEVLRVDWAEVFVLPSEQAVKAWIGGLQLGEEFVKKTYKPTTFYEHLRDLRKAGCSWRGTDILLGKTQGMIPDGFAPVREDERRWTEEADIVKEQLRLYFLISEANPKKTTC